MHSPFEENGRQTATQQMFSFQYLFAKKLSQVEAGGIQGLISWWEKYLSKIKPQILDPAISVGHGAECELNSLKKCNEDS